MSNPTHELAPHRSRSVFLAIQLGSALAAALVFGLPLALVGHFSPGATDVGANAAGTAIGTGLGGISIVLGIIFIARGTPRIYDPSVPVTADHVERGTARIDGKAAYFERTTGQSDVTHSRSVHIVTAIGGLVLCTTGLVGGILVSRMFL